jgi:pilus assembly protein CpaF
MSLKDRLTQTETAIPHTLRRASDRLGDANQDPTYLDNPDVHFITGKGDQFEVLKSVVHNKLVDNMDLKSVDSLSAADVTAVAYQFLEQTLQMERIPMSRAEREVLVQELVEDILGLGPLEPLLRDPTVADILVNGPKNIYVERFGKLQRTRVSFRDNMHVMHVIERIVSAVGRRVDEKNPMVDARLKDGSRFNAIIPPLALDGPSMSIRKFKTDAGTIDKLLGWHSLTVAMAQTLEAAVKSRMNIVISGGTGAGKTTLLNSLSSMIPTDERIVTIEDSAELQLQQDHVVRLETRPSNIEGEGKIEARDLVINALRMRPDRIVVGECRGGETLDMLQAMNTGHDGSLTTLHANTPRDALTRIQTMCMMNDHPLPEKTIKAQIGSAVHLIVQASRLQDGSRKITSISELTGMEGETITMQEIFKFEQVGIDPEGKVIGHHTATGLRPRFLDICESRGVYLPHELFKKLEEGERQQHAGQFNAAQGSSQTANARGNGLPAGVKSPLLTEGATASQSESSLFKTLLNRQQR